jgi:hypothetical protein
MGHHYSLAGRVVQEFVINVVIGVGVPAVFSIDKYRYALGLLSLKKKESIVKDFWYNRDLADDGR